MKKLSESDKKLWKKITQKITPLGEPLPANEPNPIVISMPTIPERKPKPTKPERTLDLHGLTQREAHRELQTKINVWKMQGVKWVLVITGKGHGKGKGEKGKIGVLKRLVPMWMETPAFKRLVRKVETAKREHGGDGALYVWLN